MFHFVWYTLKINFHLMWDFGLGELRTKLKKSKVTKDAKKFKNCDNFLYLIWTGVNLALPNHYQSQMCDVYVRLGFLLYALDEFTAQRGETYPDSWSSLFDFVRNGHTTAAGTDELWRYNDLSHANTSKSAQVCA